jgi:hypothetical protein
MSFRFIVSNEAQLFTKDMLRNPQQWLKSVFFRSYLNLQEMQARAKIINDFNPHVSLHIGFGKQL